MTQGVARRARAHITDGVVPKHEQLRAILARRIAEELWPMVDAGPSTELGREEAAWLAARAA